MPANLAPLLPGNTYHIYNRALGSEKLFYSPGNYKNFLKCFDEYISPIADTYCYCLLPNHFHFLIKVKPIENINLRIFSKNEEDLPGLTSKRFSNLFNSYSKTFNKIYQRKGALFMRPFKRSIVEKDAYFSKLIHYIHANPVHHGLCKEMHEWKYSSYNSLLSDLPTKLLRNELIEWFGSKDRFIKFHSQPIERKFKT